MANADMYSFDHTIRKREPEKDKVEDKPGNVCPPIQFER